MDSSDMEIFDDIIEISSDTISATSLEGNAEETGVATAISEWLTTNLSSSSESERNESDGELSYDGDAEEDVETTRKQERTSELLTGHDNFVPSAIHETPVFPVARRNILNPSIRRNAASYRHHIDPLERRPYLRAILNRSPVLHATLDNSDIHENREFSASENPVLPATRENRENSLTLGNRVLTPAHAKLVVSALIAATRDSSAVPVTRGNSVSATCENSVPAATRLNPVVPTISENSVVHTTHENSVRPTTSGSFVRHSPFSWGTSDESEPEFGFKAKQPSESRFAKRPRRHVAQGVTDVAAVSTVSGEMVADNVVQPKVEPIVSTAVSATEDLHAQEVEATDTVGIEAVERGSENGATEFIRPRLSILPLTDRTHDFQLMNQRMQVLERSMRYVAAQIVAMTANRPSPANMRLWAQQQCRAEQERMRSMTQILPNYVNNPNALTELQARAHLRLHLHNQLDTQAQAEVDARALVDEEDQDSVHGLTEQMIKDHLSNHTDEFIYSSNSTRETKCIICYEDFDKGTTIRRLRCEHCFHRHCVDHWFTTSQLRCPMCRANVVLDHSVN